MANRHFGNLGDVWKHLVLAEVLAIERPLHYWETHAGSAGYPLSPSRARGYGVYGFLEESRHDRVLAESHYCRVLEGEVDRSVPMYPGSPLIPMRLLLSDTDYVFCDLDRASTDSLERAADELVPRATRRRLARLGKHLAATSGKLDTPATSTIPELDFLELSAGISEAPQEES